MRIRSVTLGLLVLVLTTGGCDTGSGAAPVAQVSTDPEPITGPLVVRGDPQPLPPEAWDQFLVSSDGASAFLYPGEDGSLLQVRDAPPVVLPAGTNFSRDSAAHLAADGSLVQLSFLLVDDALTLHVVRAGPGTPATAVAVDESGVDRFARDDVDAVSGDGATVVLARTLPRDTPVADAGVVSLTRVDTASAVVTGRATIDLGYGEPDLLAMVVGPDGAPSVLVELAGPGEGPQLLRLDSDLQPVGRIDLAPGADPDTTVLDVAADGTVLAGVQDRSGRASTTRVLSVRPGSTEVEQVADLAGLVVSDLVAGPTDWAYLVARDADDQVAVRPFELSTGLLGDPVGLCSEAAPGALAASPDRRTVAVTVECGVVVLG